MYKLPEQVRDAIINYLAQSRLPYVEAVQIISLLQKLEKEEEKEVV